MIILSAGHDPVAKGAEYNGFNEFDEATLWVETIRRLIADSFLYPCSVAPHSRSGNTQSANAVLIEKVKWMNQQADVKLIVEVHFNSDESKRQRGSETLYCPGSSKGKKAAELVQAELGGLFPPSRGAKEGWYRMDKPGHVDYPGDVDGDEKVDYLLRAVKPVALILEPEFIYNRETIESKRDAACAKLASACVFIAETIA